MTGPSPFRTRKKPTVPFRSLPSITVTVLYRDRTNSYRDRFHIYYDQQDSIKFILARPCHGKSLDGHGNCLDDHGKEWSR